MNAVVDVLNLIVGFILLIGLGVAVWAWLVVKTGGRR